MSSIDGNVRPNIPRMTTAASDAFKEERSQICSTTGLDIEGQIANGGGIGAMRENPGYPPLPGT
jgi:hypothetical protein